MHDALQVLSRRHDRMQGSAKHDPNRTSVATIVQPKQLYGAHLFADRVVAAMDDDLLRYTKRLELLKAAGRSGIGRFEANLIIAAVQHRQTAGRSEQRAPEVPNDSPKRWKPLLTLAALVVVQAMILAGATWAWHV